jgi:hypothetical protein
MEGNRYLARIGIKAAIDDDAHRRDLFNRIDRDYPRSRYDVDVSATRVVFEALADAGSMMHAVKIYLYNHPSEHIQEITYLAGLYLRDRYLEAHPDIAD